MLKKKKLAILYHKFFRKYLKIQLFRTLLTIIMIVLGLVHPIMDQQLIDTVITGRNIQIFPYLLAGYIVINVIIVFISIRVQKINVETDIASNNDLKLQVLENIQKKARFDPAKKADAIITLSSDSKNIINLFNDTFWTAILNITNIVIILFYLFRHSFSLTMIILVNSGIQLLLTDYFSKHYLVNYEKARENSEAQYRYFDSTLINFKLIKNFCYEKMNLQKYIPLLSNYSEICKANFSISKKQSISFSTINLVSTILMVLLGVHYVFSGVITLGIYVVFLGYSDRLSYSMNAVLENIKAYKTIDISLDRFFLYLDCDEHSLPVKEPKDYIRIGEKISKVEFHDIVFKYDDKNVFNKYNACFQANNFYVMRGENGVGKSSLIELLLRDYELNGGDIFINDINIKNLNPETVKRMVSVAFQEEYFINDTILSNITMGNTETDGEKIEKVLELTRCKEFIECLELGLNTKMDEIENKFSKGELQRLNIARALLKEADIYIFDEAVSNVDNETKNYIIAGIRDYLKDKIVILITHDMELINHTDWEIVTVE